MIIAYLMIIAICNHKQFHVYHVSNQIITSTKSNLRPPLFRPNVILSSHNHVVNHVVIHVVNHVVIHVVDYNRGNQRHTSRFNSKTLQ